MSYDGSHLVCEKHEIATAYSTIKKEWECNECEIERKSKSW